MNSSDTARQYGKYLLLDRIGQGGMAELFRAKLTGAQGFEKLLALKRILPHLADDESLVTAFIDEARLAAFLQHPNIVQIYDFGELEGSYYIAMEYLSGKDLSRVNKMALQQQSPLPLCHCLYIIAQVCEGLGYAYNLTDFNGIPLRVIHRDVSPQNVFITYDGQVKLLDFGIAKAATQSTMTQTGMIKGKVAYMSPEQVRGEPIDHRTDLFAVGVMLYELATHERLYTGDMLEIMAKVARAERIPIEARLPEAPPAFHHLVDRLMAKDREERYGSAFEVVQDIQRVLGQLCASTPNSREVAKIMGVLFAGERQDEVERLKTLSNLRQASNTDAQSLPTLFTSLDSAAATHSATDTKTIVTSQARESDQAPSTTRPAVARQRSLRYLVGGGLVGLALLVGGGYWWSQSGPPGGERSDRHSAAYSEALAAAISAVQAQDIDHAQAILAPYRRQLQQLPKHALQSYLQALRDQAESLARGGRPALAEPYVNEWLQYDARDTAALFLQGNLAVKRGDNAAAVHAYRRITELAPNEARAYFNLGFLFAAAKEYQQAERMYETVVRLAPDFLDKALTNLAQMRINLGKYSQAAADLREALRINPNDAKAQALLQQIEGL